MIGASTGPELEPGVAGGSARNPLTCSHDNLLTNETVAFDHRGDLILLNQGLNRMVGAARSKGLGADPAVRTVYGLWPPDHAAVFAVIHLPMR